MKMIHTVTGPVEADRCGMALSHEHLFIDLRNQAAPDARTRPLSPADRPAVMRDPYSFQDNLLMDDFSCAAAECRGLLECGCDTVADCSTARIGRNPPLLKRLAEETGMKIVMGCGHYTADTHSSDCSALSAEALAEQMLQEFLNGAENTGIRPGVIGELGTGRELLPAECKVLRAAALTQKQTGAAIQAHIYPWSDNGLAVLKILSGAGVPPDRIVICHSDVMPDRTYIRRLLREGVFVQLDNFGKEFTPGEGGFAGGRFAPDRERAELAARIIESGFGKQLLLTNDICLKCMLPAYGGAGFRHIFRDIVPMISSFGIAEEYLKKEILRNNPLRMLSF